MNQAQKDYRAKLDLSANGGYASKTIANTADLSLRLLAKCDDAEGVHVERALIDALIASTADEHRRNVFIAMRGLQDHMTFNEEEDALIELELSCSLLMDDAVAVKENLNTPYLR